MGPDDFLESEVGIAIAAVTLLFSPRVRGLLRRGAVVGLGGLLEISGSLRSVARDLSSDIGGRATTAGDGLEDITAPTQIEAETPGQGSDAQTVPEAPARRARRKRTDTPS